MTSRCGLFSCPPHHTHEALQPLSNVAENQDRINYAKYQGPPESRTHKGQPGQVDKSTAEQRDEKPVTTGRVEAKPIAAVITRTASTSGYELGLLAAAGVLTIIPGAIVIYFVRNYIAKGFAMGRV